MSAASSPRHARGAFCVPPTGPNQVWQLDFSDLETTSGGTWRIADCRDYVSKYEHPWHVSPTANQFDAIEAVEIALAEYEAMFSAPLVHACEVDTETGELLPVVTLVTDIQTQLCSSEPALVRPAGAGSGGPVPAGRGLMTEWSALRLLAC